jgi:hypothetical protein
MRSKIYANRLGMIPSTEIAFALRLDAERQRRETAARQLREERTAERTARRRDFWSRVRESLTATLRPAA